MVGTYEINGIKIIDNEPQLVVLSPYGYTYKYSTIKGLYHFTFPGLLLGKYRTLFYDVIGYDDILYCLVFSTVSIDDDEENADDLTEELINKIINDVIKDDEEELKELENELKHLSSNVLV